MVVVVAVALALALVGDVAVVFPKTRLVLVNLESSQLLDSFEFLLRADLTLVLSSSSLLLVYIQMIPTVSC